MKERHIQLSWGPAVAPGPPPQRVASERGHGSTDEANTSDQHQQQQRRKKRPAPSSPRDIHNGRMPSPPLPPQQEQRLSLTSSSVSRPLYRSSALSDWYSKTFREAGELYKQGVQLLFQEGVVDLCRAEFVLKGMRNIMRCYGVDPSLGSYDLLKMLTASHPAGSATTATHRHRLHRSNHFAAASDGGGGGDGGDAHTVNGAVFPPSASSLGSFSISASAPALGDGGAESSVSYSSARHFLSTYPPISAHASKANIRHNINSGTGRFEKMVDRLFKDPTACCYFYRIRNAEEYTLCSPRMEELFVTTVDMRAMQKQFKLLGGFLWCTFLFPADRARIMRAVAVASLEQGAKMQVDTVARCVCKDGQIVKCLVSIAFHANGEGDVYVMFRLLPLGFRSLAVGVGAEGRDGMESSLMRDSSRERKRNNVEIDGEGLPPVMEQWTERPAMMMMRADDGSGEGRRENREEGGGRGEGREGDDEGAPFCFRPIAVPTPSQQQQQGEEDERKDGEEEEAFPPGMWQFVQEALLP